MTDMAMAAPASALSIDPASVQIPGLPSLQEILLLDALGRMSDESILEPALAALYLRVSEQTLARLRSEGGGPDYSQPKEGGRNAKVQPLLAAVEAGDLPAVAKLLAAGESPNASDEDGNGLLHLAVQAGRHARRMGELLAEHGADVNAKNNWGDTPLHVAVWPEEYFEPDAETVSALLALRGLRLDEPNAQGRTALSLAVEGGEFGDRVNEAIVGLLLSRGADPSIADCEGRTPLDWANGVAVGMLSGVLRKPLLAEPTDGK